MIIASPHIQSPTHNQQFNLGVVSVSWSQIESALYLEEGIEMFRVDYPTQISIEDWLDIQQWFVEASIDNEGGTDYNAARENIQQWFSDHGITLSDDFIVETVDSVYGEYFEFKVIDGDNIYTVVSYSTSGSDNLDIIVTLAYQITSVDSSDITYEIEYTDDYVGVNTNWHTFKRRIPWNNTTYIWNVGKMIKSSTVRIRIRSRYSVTELVSDWSMSDEFAVNVFKLIAPAIVNPLPNLLYTDFILIILDESLTRNTYNQKVRYTLEYSSVKQSIDWTTIKSDLPVGQNVVRWNIEDVPTSDDYVIRLTTKNVSTSCIDPTSVEPDQIARSFVYSVKIQQSGLFIIDTKPPEAILEINNQNRVTNQLNQVINIFAEDETTGVKQIQLRECSASESLILGDLADKRADELSQAIQDATTEAETQCTSEGLTESECDKVRTQKIAQAIEKFGSGCDSIADLLAGSREFDKLITDSPIGSSTKIQWVFDALDADGEPVSDVKKIEALLTDHGGNTSIQEQVKVFLSVFSNDNAVNDFTTITEQRDKITFSSSNEVTTESSTYEVVYAGTSSGELWILEPFARQLYTITNHPEILKLHEFNDIMYIYAYNRVTDEGALYRHDSTVATSLHTFSGSLAIVTGICEFDNALFFGMESGALWKYNGYSFTLVNTFLEPVNTLYGDEGYLYIGFQNSDTLTIYDGVDFTELEI